MPRSRRRKDSSFEASVTKSVFLYGRPNKDKLALLRQMQTVFTALVNEDIQILSTREDLMMQLVKNDKKDSTMRTLEKTIRRKGLSSAFSQNAFDVAVTHLSNRLDEIRLDLLAEGMDPFARSKVLFAMSIMRRSRLEMISAMEDLKEDFYLDCAKKLRDMTEEEFMITQKIFQDLYAMKCMEYRIPQLRSVSVPLDSRLMKIEPSDHVKTPYVICMTDPFRKNHRIQIPIDTSAHSLHKIRNISSYLRTHDLPDDVRRSLIEKMDRLSDMMQTMDAPYRKKRHYYDMLNTAIASAVKEYMGTLSPEILTVLEKLDIKEFTKSKTSNARFSMFARGKLQHRLMEELNWRGFDFLEVVPDYTSQVCPVCHNLDSNNRNGKDFTCTCCRHHDDADHVGSLNIKARAFDKEIKDICEKHKYNHKNLQTALRALYAKRHQEYINTESA